MLVPAGEEEGETVAHLIATGMADCVQDDYEEREKVSQHTNARSPAPGSYLLSRWMLIIDEPMLAGSPQSVPAEVDRGGIERDARKPRVQCARNTQETKEPKVRNSVRWPV